MKQSVFFFNYTLVAWEGIPLKHNSQFTFCNSRDREQAKLFAPIKSNQFSSQVGSRSFPVKPPVGIIDRWWHIALSLSFPHLRGCCNLVGLQKINHFPDNATDFAGNHQGRRRGQKAGKACATFIMQGGFFTSVHPSFNVPILAAGVALAFLTHRHRPSALPGRHWGAGSMVQSSLLLPFGLLPSSCVHTGLAAAPQGEPQQDGCQSPWLYPVLTPLILTPELG